MPERQLTRGPGGRVLTNDAVWSPDGEWIAYDTRSDPAGERFDGTRIETVSIRTGEVRELFRSPNGAHCGVVTWHPKETKVVFILGPERPTADWAYSPYRRQGVIVDADRPGVAVNLDARDLVSPYTPGALRGGSHVHRFSPSGEWVSFTYEDAVLARFDRASAGNEVNLRTVAVGVPAGKVAAGGGHPRNHDGTYFCVVAVRCVADPETGSDQVRKAFEECWLGERFAVAFQGHVVTPTGETISEVFVAELPADARVPGDGPLQGTPTTAPRPPNGTTQRRLTHTAGRKHPGLQGPRHWLKTSPDGVRVACLMRDNRGRPQIWTVPTDGGEPKQLTRADAGVESAFTWSQDGSRFAFLSGGRVAIADANSGAVRFATDPGESPRPEACVLSPDGRRVAFVRNVGGSNQVCVADVP